jgi:hypothetical protein
MVPLATAAAERSARAAFDRLDGVAARGELLAAGVTKSAIAANVRARRWQRLGTAIVLHNTRPTTEQREQAYLITCGPRSVLTSFTAAARCGLVGWDRPEIHVLAPAGTRRPHLPKLVLHRVADWSGADTLTGRRLHRLGPCLIVAAGSLPSPRLACAILASAVQQRLITAQALHSALDRQPKIRHYRAIQLALHDIAQGSHALSEIDFVQLCRRYRLPPPYRQGVRVEPGGRRRYLDAEWRLPDGTILAVEVDGAIHVAPERWYADQLRQNELVLGGTRVLRYPSVVVRTEEARVASQLRRGLGIEICAR